MNIRYIFPSGILLMILVLLLELQSPQHSETVLPEMPAKNENVYCQVSETVALQLPAEMDAAVKTPLIYDAETVPAIKREPEQSLPLQIGLWKDGVLVCLDLEEYILGVVLAEMPARFEAEALKAQAVAARTYTLKNCIAGFKHPAGTVCNRSSCCQAYRSEEEYLSAGGKRTAVEKVSAAVKVTAGEVLVYHGKLIDAAYFSCSGGYTEDAVSVWGYDVPYLQAVPSPGEENAGPYRAEIQLTTKEFCQKLGLENDSVRIEEISYTAGGGVDKITIGGKTWTGTKFRSLLGLRSTVFSISVEGDTVFIQTLGYGHRVGMSQYGANAMAAAGSSYVEILSHYYLGAELTQYPLQ